MPALDMRNQVLDQRRDHALVRPPQEQPLTPGIDLQKQRHVINDHPVLNRERQPELCSQPRGRFSEVRSIDRYESESLGVGVPPVAKLSGLPLASPNHHFGPDCHDAAVCGGHHQFEASGRTGWHRGHAHSVAGGGGFSPGASPNTVLVRSRSRSANSEAPSPERIPTMSSPVRRLSDADPGWKSPTCTNRMAMTPKINTAIGRSAYHGHQRTTSSGFR